MLESIAWMVLVAVPWAVQERPSLDRWIGELADDEPSVRESAHQELLQAGPRAIAPLRQALTSTDTEVRERATAVLGELERDVKLAALIPTAPAVTLTLKDVSFSLALKDIARITGVGFEGVLHLPGKPVSATFTQAPLLQVLDELGAAAVLQWTFAGDSTVAWRHGAPVDRPNCYSGGFRASLARIDVTKSWNFRQRGGLLWVYLETRTEPGIRPLDLPRFEVREIRDESGNELASDPVMLECAPKGYSQESFGGSPGTLYESQPFTITPLQHRTRMLSKISGRAVYVFPQDRASIEITDLCEESSAALGDLQFQVNDILSSSMRLTVRAGKSMADLRHRIDVNSLVLVDAQGKTYTSGRDFSVQAELISLNALRYHLQFNENLCFQPVAVKFTVITRFFEKSVPFEFKNVPLP